MGRSIVWAFQTIGVVFGDVGISPLYTFSVMFRKAPINGNEDILGALSLVLYTLILIPLVKYVLVVLWANDDGEGKIIFIFPKLNRFFIEKKSSMFCSFPLNVLHEFHFYSVSKPLQVALLPCTP